MYMYLHVLCTQKTLSILTRRAKIFKFLHYFIALHMIRIPWRLHLGHYAEKGNKHPCIPASIVLSNPSCLRFCTSLFHQSSRIEVPLYPHLLYLSTQILRLQLSPHFALLFALTPILLLSTQLYLSSYNLTPSSITHCDYPASAYDGHHGISYQVFFLVWKLPRFHKETMGTSRTLMVSKPCCQSSIPFLKVSIPST